jgi:hypothetical protein
MPKQQTKLSWADRYRPERLFYLLLASVILSVPANLLQSIIAQGPDSVALSKWSQLYIFRMALTYPVPATVIGLLSIALAIYGFRLDQRHKKAIAEKEKQTRLKESDEQIRPVHDIVQGVAERKYIPPDVIDGEYLDTDFVITLQGENIFGDPIYTYVKLSGRNMKRMFAKMWAHETFKPADFGTVLVAGRGEPSQEIRDKMKEEYNMVDVPGPGISAPNLQPNFLDDEDI